PTAAVTGRYEISVNATGSDGSAASAGPPSAGTVVFAGNAPPTVTIIVAPPPAPQPTYLEGNTVSLTGTVTDPGPDLTYATYLWTITGPDNFVATGVQPAITFTPYEVGTYTATLTVTDSNMGVATATASIPVAHVPPQPSLRVVNIAPDGSVNLQ